MWKRVATALGLAASPILAADEVRWPALPASGFIRGRPATIEDAKRHDAVFSMNGGSKGALAIEVPQYAIWTNKDGVRQAMILIQAERAPDGMEMVGLRGLDGSETVATMPEVTLLGTKKPH